MQRGQVQAKSKSPDRQFPATRRPTQFAGNLGGLVALGLAFSHSMLNGATHLQWQLPFPKPLRNPAVASSSGFVKRQANRIFRHSHFASLTKTCAELGDCPVASQSVVEIAAPRGQYSIQTIGPELGLRGGDDTFDNRRLGPGIRIHIGPFLGCQFALGLFVAISISNVAAQAISKS